MIMACKTIHGVVKFIYKIVCIHKFQNFLIDSNEKRSNYFWSKLFLAKSFQIIAVLYPNVGD